MISHQQPPLYTPVGVRLLGGVLILARVAFAIFNMKYFQCFLLSLLVAKFGATASIPVVSTNLVNSRAPNSINIPDSVHNATSTAGLAPDNTFAPKIASNENLVRFNDTVYDAVVTTIIQYPKAVFLQVQATADGDPTADPEEIQDVRLIFEMNGKTLYVEMREWGQWGPPRVTRNSPPAGNGPLPLQIAMDLPEADLLIRNAGFREPYIGVDVRWPIDIPQSRQQIYYFFWMVGSQPFTLAVGTRDSIVQANSAVGSAVDVGDGWFSGNDTSTS